jgi:hypothetical protein
MSHRSSVVGFVLVTFTFALVPVNARPGEQQVRSGAFECRPAGSAVRVAELPEASGIASSRLVPGRLWSHNDSSDPVLIALDTKGSVTGRIRLSGVQVEDWEAIAVGPCPAGSCINVADIGDNNASRSHITVYRVTEPEAAAESAPATAVFRGSYPDGPQDAEALLVTPDGRLHVVTKGETGPVAIYRFPPQPQAGATVRLERVGKPREPGKPDQQTRITDGAVSQDGEWVVLRSSAALTFYRASELLSGSWREAGRTNLESLGEPQGEGVAFGDRNTIYLVGEGGGRSRPGTFARLTCATGG